MTKDGEQHVDRNAEMIQNWFICRYFYAFGIKICNKTYWNNVIRLDWIFCIRISRFINVIVRGIEILVEYLFKLDIAKYSSPEKGQNMRGSAQNIF